MAVGRRFSRDEQVALLTAVDQAMAAAPPETLTLALLRGLVAAHNPHRWDMQCVGRFERDGVAGCSLCETHGEPIAVTSPQWNPQVVFHTHLDPKPTCDACGLDWPCVVVEVVRATLTSV